MPKEKATRKTKAKATADGGKKKKGELFHCPNDFKDIFADHGHLLDPNAPKRGLSAYMFFANEQRENVREENPGITFGMVTSTNTACQRGPANHLAQFRTSWQGPGRAMEGTQRQAARPV